MKNIMTTTALSAAMTLLALTSCSSSDEVTGSGASASQVAVGLTGSIGTYTRAATDVQGTQIVSGAKVGVFSFVTGNTASATTATTGDTYGYLNAPYTAGAEGALTVGDTKVYYPADGTKVDIYAYAPYLATSAGTFNPVDINAANTAENINMLPFSVQADQSLDADYEASDLLYATLTGKATSNTAYDLTFAHKLSKITVNLSKDASGAITDADLQAAKIEILGTKPTTSLNISTGLLADATGTATDIVAKTTAQNTVTSSSAIIVPQTVATGTTGTTRFIRVTIGSTEYFYVLTNAEAGTTFLTGKSYIYNLTVTAVGLQLTSSTIIAWGTTTNVIEEAPQNIPAVGNIYYADGTYSSTYDSSKTPIGIVVSVNPAYCEQAKGYGHGLVMALNDAGTSIAWKTTNDDAGLTKCSTYTTLYHDVSGLTNQTTVVPSSTYPAFNAAYNYLSTAHPKGSSSWFLPSAGQWWDAMEKANTKKDGSSLTIAGYHDSTNGAGNWVSGDYKALTALNSLMSNYSGLTYTAIGDHVYWTGSEYNTGNACLLKFYSNGDLCFGGGNKTNTYYVRPFLAF